MSKYICLCGMTFKKQFHCDAHMKIHEDLELKEGFTRHIILKQHWQARFLKWFFEYPWLRIVRVVGASMIYFAITHHFHINFSLWEAIAIGIGLGLYVD